MTEPCICGPWHPNMDGPDETCPQHGRPYSYWVEGFVTLQARVADARNICEAASKRQRESVEKMFGGADFPAYVSADEIRAALEGGAS